MNESKIYFDKRWKLCILGYVVAYMVSIGNSGTPSLIYYIPIKMSAFYVAWIGGTAGYNCGQAMKKGEAYIFLMPGFIFKYGIPGFIVCLLLELFIGKILYMFGIDSRPFLDL